MEMEESHSGNGKTLSNGRPNSRSIPRSSSLRTYGLSAQKNGDLKQVDSKKSPRRLSFGDRPLHTLEAGSENFLLSRAMKREAASWNVLVTEVVPANCTLQEKNVDADEWEIPIDIFRSKKQSHAVGRQSNKRVRSYYEAQDKLIDAYDNIESGKLRAEVSPVRNFHASSYRQGLKYSRITLLVNFNLLVAKLIAGILSGSMAVISSVVDSSLDLFSGIILWWASRAVKSRSLYSYPQGRTKLEPVAIIILSVVMALASVQIIRESIEKIIDLANNSAGLPDVRVVTFCIMGATIVTKFILYLICRRVHSHIAQALALDHRNDIASNSVAIVCGYLGSSNFISRIGVYDFSYVDPVGAILISLYIIYNWWQTGSDQIKMLTGHTAEPDFLSQLTWVSLYHDQKIQQVDTVRAFHFGSNFLVEVDIVLPANMPLREAHDIGESLQRRLEALSDVERAFVHLDYEFTHHPHSEHKIV